jgi:hypothetical protein
MEERVERLQHTIKPLSEGQPQMRQVFGTDHKGVLIFAYP